MNRAVRHRLLWPLLVATLAALVAVRCGGPSAPRPNVLLLVMDTTRADRCSFVDAGRPTTPELEKLAADSVVFTDAWSPSCWTMPAHTALFTGRHPDELGVADGRARLVPRTIPMLAERFRDGGWRTGCYTNNAWIAAHTGLSRGFEEIEPLYIAAAGPSAQQAHRGAIAWMRKCRAKDEPFFVFVNDVEPHAPYTPPEEFARRFLSPGTPDDVLLKARTLIASGVGRHSSASSVPDDVLRAVNDLYDAEVAQLDAEIGKLIDAMRADGLLENTLIVIVGDHGEGLGDHGWIEHGGLLYRELLRVPLLVRPPGGTPGRRVAGVVPLEDVPTTIVEVCGLDLAPGETGRNLLGPSPSRPSAAAERARLEWQDLVKSWMSAEEFEVFARKRRSVYDGRHHLIVDAKGVTELYDVAADPRERTNLAATSPDVVERLTKLLSSPAPR